LNFGVEEEESPSGCGEELPVAVVISDVTTTAYSEGHTVIPPTTITAIFSKLNFAKDH